MGRMYPVCPTCGLWFGYDGESFDPTVLWVIGLPYEQERQCNACFDNQRPFSD